MTRDETEKLISLIIKSKGEVFKKRDYSGLDFIQFASKFSIDMEREVRLAMDKEGYPDMPKYELSKHILSALSRSPCWREE